MIEIAWSIADIDSSKPTEALIPPKVFCLYRTMSRSAQVRVVCSMTSVTCTAKTKGNTGECRWTIGVLCW